MKSSRPRKDRSSGTVLRVGRDVKAAASPQSRGAKRANSSTVIQHASDHPTYLLTTDPDSDFPAWAIPIDRQLSDAESKLLAVADEAARERLNRLALECSLLLMEEAQERETTALQRTLQFDGLLHHSQEAARLTELRDALSHPVLPPFEPYAGERERLSEVLELVRCDLTATCALLRRTQAAEEHRDAARRRWILNARCDLLHSIASAEFDQRAIPMETRIKQLRVFGDISARNIACAMKELRDMIEIAQIH